MLDVHPTHGPTHTWRDFLLHIATIVVGLLIAVGLEQTVELLHRKHQVAETRKALEIERRINRNRFAVTTEQFERFVPILQQNLALFVALRNHPGSAASLPPLDWNALSFEMQDGAWQTAKQNSVLESMPVSEARGDAALYERLGFMNADNEVEHKAVNEARLFAIADPNPSHLSPEQLDHQIELTARAIQACTNVAIDQTNLHREFPDFSPAPTQQEVLAIRHQAASPEWFAYSRRTVEHIYDFEKAQTADSSPSH